MNFRRIILMILFLGLLPGMMTTGWSSTRKKETKKKPAKKESAYQLLFKDQKRETVKGLFTIHKMDRKIYFELPLSLLGKEMLIGSTISKTTSNDFGSVGEKPHDPLHVVFTRIDSLVSLRQMTSLYTTADENLAERINESTEPAIIKSFPIKAYAEDSTAIVIDFTDFLLSDNSSLSPFSDYAPILWGERQLEKDFSKENSQVVGVKAFSDNVSVQSSLSYQVSVSDKRYYYIYKRPFTVVMNRSFILLPEIPMRPRIADPRINIFTSGRTEFSNSGTGVKPLYYANRWRLEPVDEEKYRRGELVEPKKPIVFYVDNAFPETWKKYIKEGIEQWQVAFEKIGFKNAIITKDFPMDDPEFDPDNIKYSCVRYSPSWEANAMGPSWTDPRTGEIINASVYLYHNLIELVQSWHFLHTSPADPSVRKMVLDDATIGECIHYVVTHEVGHCLALMHNMAGSSAIPVDSLRSPSFTQEFGTTYSIMDYARNNYVAQPGDKERGVKLTPPALGVYDFYSIKWLYTPLYEAKNEKEEIPVLDQWITEKSHDPIYRYGKQQITYRFDPSAFEEDLGDDAMKAATYGINNLQYILKNLNDWVGKEDRDFRFRQNTYVEAMYQYIRYLNQVLYNIGGIYLNERYEGDARPSYKPVETEKQRRATRFMLEQIKSLSWVDNKELLEAFPLRSKLAADLEDYIFSAVMKRFSSVAISSSRAEKDGYTPKEYMDDIYHFIWEPTERGRVLSDTEKKLQIKYLTYCINNAGVNPGGDAQELALTTNTTMIAVPDYLKEKSKEIYGTQPEDIFSMFENERMSAPVLKRNLAGNLERQGFGYFLSVNPPTVQLEHIYFNRLKQTLALLKSRATPGTDDTNQHYKLLIYKLEKSIKVVEY